MKKLNAKRLLALMLTLVMLLTSIPLTLSVSAETVRPEGTTADTALSVKPTSSGSFNFDGYVTSFVQDLWLKVTLSKRGILNLNCNKLADASGELDYTYFYVYKSADVTAAIKNNTQMSTSLAVWSDSYYRYEKVKGDYNFNIPLDKGTYYIYFDTTSYYNEHRTLTWKLKFTATSDYEIEPNNGTNAATKMSLNKIVRGYTDTSYDYYSLKLTKNTPIRLYISGYEKLAEKYVSLSIALPDGTTDYISTSEVAKNSSGYYYDVLLKKGTNVISVSTSTPSIKYGLKASTNISYPALTITDVEKEISGSYFDAKIYWDALAGIDGYQVYCKTGSGSWKKVYECSKYSNGVALYNYKKNTSYQFRIRAYKEFGSTKHYGEWSKIVYMNPTPTNIKLSTTTYTYNGKVKTPSLTIKDKAGKTLKKGTDYTVSYAKGRKNVGTYKVTITFKGKYSGKVTKTFKIIPAKTSVSKLTAGSKKLTVKWAKKSTQVTGYQIQYSTSKSFKSYKSKTVSSYKTTSATLKSLSAKKTYYVRVRTYKTVNGTKYYSGWSTIKYKKTK